jgi:tripartite-type tricarboxylate transporter receptor subunit TctC
MTTSTRFNMRRTFTLAALAFVGLGSAISSQAQAWPSKPIRIVVGFAPGGTTDVMARLMAQQLSESLGQSVVIDNKPGASGNIAAAEVARAAPDGHTLFISPTSVETANPSLFKSSPVLPSRDLTPVAGIGKTQMYLVAKPQTTAKDVRELVAQAKAQPGKLSYASAGAGTPPHLACELLAIVSEKRSPFFPDVPTVAEQGFRGNYMDIWFGMWTPNGTPAEIVSRLSRELAKALAQPAVKSRYADLGAENVALDTGEFRNLLTSEGRLLSGLIRDQKITVE